MGVVFLAEDTQLRRSVALKAMLPEIAEKDTCRERFLREAQAAAAIEHDHIVTIHHVGEEGGVPFLVMPLLKGESLDDRLTSKDRPDLAEVLRLGREIAAGLAAAHAHGLIHRDIKPANIWLDGGADSRVKILDFGLARPAQDETHLTHSGVIVGTPSYMSPEQASGKVIDGRADLWSLGCVLYRLCTGRLPFTGTDMMAVLLQAALEPPTPPCQLNPDVPPALDDLVMRLISKEPKDRPASAQAVVDEIRTLERRLIAGSSEATTQSLSAPNAPPRRRLLVAALVLLFGGLVAGGIVYVQTDKGLLKIETLDDDVQVLVEQNGKLVKVLDKKNGTEVVLRSGEYTVRVGEANKNVKVEPTALRITRGVTSVAKITRVRSTDDPIVDTELDKWIISVQKMPPARQVRAVMEKLREFNPDFDGKEEKSRLDVEAGTVVELAFWTDHVVDIRPVRALSKLTTLTCAGSSPGKGKLASLAPLKVLPLKELNCSFNPELASFAPLLGMPLERLDCTATQLSDLAPLARGLPLVTLKISGTRVSDLSPLKLLLLKELKCDFKPERDTSVLKSCWTLEKISGTGVEPGATMLPAIDFWKQHDLAHAAFLLWIADTKKLATDKQIEAVRAKLIERNPGFDGVLSKKPEVKDGVVTQFTFKTDLVTDLAPVRVLDGLKQLGCGTQWDSPKGALTDLSPLKGLQLTSLYIVGTNVEDLSPLKGMPLEILFLDNSKVVDLTPLQGMPLLDLGISHNSITSLLPLKGLPLQKLTCHRTNITDLSPLQGMPLRILLCSFTRVTDLSSLKDLMRLTKLAIGESGVADLSPLKDLRLTWLDCQDSKVSDLSPLKDMRLTSLQCNGSKVTDLTLLRGMALKELRCDFKPERDAAILKDVWTLGIINGTPVIDFWKQHDPAHAAFLQWIADTRKLPADKQIEAVRAKLIDRNPGYDGTSITKEIKAGVVTRLAFRTDKVKDLAPVRALPGLTSLHCFGSGFRNGKLTSLQPLLGLPLTTLNCGSNPDIGTLAPLVGMPLKSLGCYWCNLEGQALAPLKGMSLEQLNAKGQHIRDLSPLRGMPITDLDLTDTNVVDLEPLRDTPLAKLHINHPTLGIADVSRYRDLSVLRTTPLIELFCDACDTENNVEALRALASLKTVKDDSQATTPRPAATALDDAAKRRAAFDAWCKMVASLPAKKQVEEVADELKRRNPAFDGKIGSRIDKEVVTELRFSTDHVTDIAPMRALTELRVLHCSGSFRRNGKLTDLTPLKGMKLTILACHYSRVWDLSPLKDMKLTFLSCNITGVADLSPLKDMPLIDLRIHDTQVSDLTPLQGMKLLRLYCDHTKISDLSPLKDMPLTILEFRDTRVTDLSPLKGMPFLKTIHCDFNLDRDGEILRSIKTLEKINDRHKADLLARDPNTFPPLDAAWVKKVQALTPERQVEEVADELKRRNPGFAGTIVSHKIVGAVVTELRFLTDNVTDIAPVQALTGLTYLHCSGTAPGKGELVDLSPLKTMKLRDLRFINTLVSDLSPLKDMQLTNLGANNTRVIDLSPLKDMKLTELHLNETRVSDLSPLKDMQLIKLACWKAPVSDLSPLKDMKLKYLYIRQTKVTDLSLLRDMPLLEIDWSFKNDRNVEILRSIKTLTRINVKPAAEFWKEVDAQPAFDTWLKQVAAMPAAKQVDAVAAKLQERNPGFDGKITSHKIEDGVVTELQFRTDNVTDIAPVRALVGLHTLLIGGSGKYWEERNGKLSDLSPLSGMKLVYLAFSGTHVSDLSPLQEMKLEHLSLAYTLVSDLSPLKNMQLTHLDFFNTSVSDLSPLRDMQLTHLTFSVTPVADLAPLKDMKLSYLRCEGTRVSNLLPLKGMPLTSLSINSTRVTDLSPLEGMPLTILHIGENRIADLSPLRGMPLNNLTCDFKPYRDTDILRSIMTLEKINQKPIAEFWKDVDVQQVAFDAWCKQVAALTPAQQVKAVADKMRDLNPGFDGKVTPMIDKVGVVTKLEFRSDKVSDISPVLIVQRRQIGHLGMAAAEVDQGYATQGRQVGQHAGLLARGAAATQVP